MAEYKEISAYTMYQRLAIASGLPIRAVKELQKAYAKVYCEFIQNGESFFLPGLGYIRMIPYEDELIMDKFRKVLIPRTNMYKLRYIPSAKVKKLRKDAK